MKTCYQLLMRPKMEWTESKISVRVKSVSIGEWWEEGTTELKTRIDPWLLSWSLPLLASVNLKGKKKRNKKNTIHKGGQRKSKSTPTTPMKGKGLGTPATGPSKGNQKHNQCYNCRHLGHRWRECPSKGNFNWRELGGGPGPSRNRRNGPKIQWKQAMKSERFLTEVNLYHNPDPLF